MRAMLVALESGKQPPDGGIARRANGAWGIDVPKSLSRWALDRHGFVCKNAFRPDIQNLDGGAWELGSWSQGPEYARCG
jgi:hypothetical protein